MSVIDLLVEARNEAGLSQAGLAKAMNTAQSIVARFESGTTDPRLSTLQRYLKPLDYRLTIEKIPAPTKPSVRKVTRTKVSA